MRQSQVEVSGIGKTIEKYPYIMQWSIAYAQVHRYRFDHCTYLVLLDAYEVISSPIFEIIQTFSKNYEYDL